MRELPEEKQKRMFEYMNFCNGEIRVMAGRYGGGWLACGCAVIEWDHDEKWSDLIGGDNDYFDARDYFEDNADIVLIEHADSPIEAFNACANILAHKIDNSNGY